MQTGTITKYRPSQQINLPDRTWPDNTIQAAPIWTSVDLRDGNQALAIPMNVDEKVEFFELLVATGFKEIEVGFPSASDTEFRFIRRLVEENRIPEDVTDSSAGPGPRTFDPPHLRKLGRRIQRDRALIQLDLALAAARHL